MRGLDALWSLGLAFCKCTVRQKPQMCFEEPVFVLRIGISSRGHMRTYCLMFYVIFRVKLKYKIEQNDKARKPCMGKTGRPIAPAFCSKNNDRIQSWTRGKFQKSADRVCPTRPRTL